jgi:hypothetical protein
MASRKQYAQNDMVVTVLNEWLEDNSEYNLIEIAERIGVKKSANCFMSQIRSGRSKLPISKLVPLAKLMGKDPKPMVVAVLEEYYPDLKAALVEADMFDDSFNAGVTNLREITNKQKNTG